MIDISGCGITDNEKITYRGYRFYRLHELNTEHNAAYPKQKGEHICEACVYNRQCRRRQNDRRAGAYENNRPAAVPQSYDH